jgi:hypothetical protein
VRRLQHRGLRGRRARSVTFGFRDPHVRIIGGLMRICRRHEHPIG